MQRDWLVNAEQSSQCDLAASMITSRGFIILKPVNSKFHPFFFFSSSHLSIVVGALESQAEHGVEVVHNPLNVIGTFFEPPIMRIFLPSFGLMYG